MLSGALFGRAPLNPASADVFPFCPMLAQGWTLLRAKGVTLPDQVATARNFVQESLWTTFNGSGMDLLMAALRRGALR